MLVLVEDVPDLGRQGEQVEVRPGYARNYLLPKGLATIPTAHNLRMLERYKIKIQQAREARIQDLQMLAEQISRLPHVLIEAKANESGQLYGSVGSAEISKALHGKNLQVDSDMVRLEAPIKDCAVYDVDLNLGFDIEASVQVMVIPQQEQS